MRKKERRVYDDEEKKRGSKEFEGMVDHLRLVSRYCRESIIRRRKT